ncbi:TetR family transcriptional regulator [Streptomyces laculatispora]|uniref:TetR family transcriptional regulator n=1 Tax=Streptomyces laculatispora TaxID=887464 RepID=UPI0035186019
MPAGLPRGRSGRASGARTAKSVATPRQSRADRRRSTEARILASARELFAGRAFERTTIRAVAAAAGDAALVMQYFGSKRGLFTQAVQATPVSPGTVDADVLVDQLLATLGPKLGGLPEGTLAMMRSMLTDPAAVDHVRVALGRAAGRHRCGPARRRGSRAARRADRHHLARNHHRPPVPRTGPTAGRPGRTRRVLAPTGHQGPGGGAGANRIHQVHETSAPQRRRNNLRRVVGFREDRSSSS